MDEWFYSQDGQQIGPVSFDDLIEASRDGRLKHGESVWTKSYTEWRPAESVPALFPTKSPDAPSLVAPRERLLPSQTQPPGEQPASPGADKPDRNLIARHWRGELPLSQSYWLCGVLFTVLLAIPFALLFPAVLELLARNYLGIAAVLGGLVAFSLALSIWQGVGIWRSATRSMRERRARFWPIAAKIFVVLAFLGAPWRHFPTALVAYESARLGLGLSEFERAQVALEGTMLTITGGLGPGSAALVEEALRGGRPVERVELDSRGGLMWEAQAIARLVAARRVPTHTSRVCHSACTLIFVAGPVRTIGFDARLGFHRPAGPVSGQVAAGVVEDVRRHYLAAGVPAAFVERVMATPTEELLRPEPRELLALGIVSEIRVDRAALAAVLRAYPHLAALERFDRAEFDAFLDAMTGMVRVGTGRAEVFARATELVNQLVGRYAPRLADVIMSELIAHNIEQTAWLLERDAETCAANERPGAGARMRIQPEAVNADHIARGQALLARVIENAAGERPAPAAVNVEPILERVIAAIGAVPGTNVELFERERLEPADFPVLCRTALALYRTLRDLPGPEGAAVMRTLISQSP